MLEVKARTTNPELDSPIKLTSLEKNRLRRRKIKKHHVATILLHWFNAVVWFFMLLTGAGLLVSKHYQVMPRFFLEIMDGLFSGKANMLKFHIWLGVIWMVVFAVHTIFGYRSYVRKKKIGEVPVADKAWENRIKSIQCIVFGNDALCLDMDDLRWLKVRFLRIIGKSDEPLPPQGAFNAGQKLFGLMAALMTPVIMISGLIMAFHLFGTAAVAWSAPLHFLAVGFMVAGLIVHIYMGAVFPEEKPAFFSMITGFVDELFAYTHHFKWWKEMIRDEVRWRKKTDGDVNVKNILLDRFGRNGKRIQPLINEITQELDGMTEKGQSVRKPQKIWPNFQALIKNGFKAKSYWQPYVAGALLGLLLLTTFFVMGRGLGASSAFARVDAFFVNIISTDYAQNSPVWGRYVGGDKSPLANFVIFQTIGVLIGGFLSGYLAKRVKKSVDRGPAITNKKRLVFALLGGILMGIGARIARGCTSGLALTGGSTLALGGWIFMIAVFAAGFIGAFFIRRLWL